MPEPSLPLFDESPEPDPGPAAPARPGSQARPLTVWEANTAARELIEEAFPDVWIQGEISNFKAHTSGHFYFSLKDARCQISGVMFRGANLYLKFKPADGLSVVVRGRLTLYEARGSYQINVQWMEPLGVGSLQLAFEQLKAKLKAEGLFEPQRKRTLPALPRRIAVVTSPTGAAIRDILRVLQRRHAGLAILIAPCRVQGEGAALEIAKAIENVNEYSAREGGRSIDVMIVGRGGGSIEDLWAFNDEIVARAIAASAIPVISAVGHEVDFTIADFVADLRAPTPSAAAEMVVKSRDELLSSVETARARLFQAARYTVLKRRARVDGLARNRAFARVEGALAEARQRCDEAMMRLGNELLSRLRGWRERLGLAIERLSPRSLKAEVVSRRGRLSTDADLLSRAITARARLLRERVASTEAMLRSLSPLAVLDRGYAICQDATSGGVITDAAEVSVGDDVRIMLARGGIGARVTSSRPAVPNPGESRGRE